MSPIRRSARLSAAIALALVLGLAGAPALAQTAEEIAAVQAWLNGQGYDAGPADGMMGGRTRAAIALWESEHGQPETGEVSPLLIDMAMGGGADDGGAGQGGDAATAPDSAAESAVSTLEGDVTALAGTGGLEFSEREDGTILITDGFPWRPDVVVEPRTIAIVDTAYGIFTASPESLVPVPLDDNVVDVPGSAFVPLFMAYDRAAAAQSSLADAAGIVWQFREAGLRFELDGYVLEAAGPGATIAFGGDGVLLTGFTLSPQ